MKTSFQIRALKKICEYLTLQTGKKVISNEMGQLNTQRQLVNSMLDACNSINMPYIIWYSGDAKRDGGLHCIILTAVYEQPEIFSGIICLKGGNLF